MNKPIANVQVFTLKYNIDRIHKKRLNREKLNDGDFSLLREYIAWNEAKQSALEQQITTTNSDIDVTKVLIKGHKTDSADYQKLNKDLLILEIKKLELNIEYSALQVQSMKNKIIIKQELDQPSAAEENALKRVESSLLLKKDTLLQLKSNPLLEKQEPPKKSDSAQLTADSDWKRAEPTKRGNKENAVAQTRAEMSPPKDSMNKDAARYTAKMGIPNPRAKEKENVSHNPQISQHRKENASTTVPQGITDQQVFKGVMKVRRVENKSEDTSNDDTPNPGV